MVLRQSSIILCLGLICCRTEGPTIELKVQSVVHPGSVPISAAVNHKGKPGDLTYQWTITPGCTAKFQDPNKPSTILEVASDCAGKPLLASLLVTAPGSSVEQSVSLQVIGEPTTTSASPVAVTMDIPDAPDSTVVVGGTAKPYSVAQQAHLWLVVNPVGEPGHWPQGGRLNPLPPDGRWEMKAQLKGKPGQSFNFSVVKANNAADEHFRTYIATGEKKHDFPAVPLPDGVQTLQTAVRILGGPRPCIAMFTHPDDRESVAAKDVAVELTVTKSPPDKANYYVLEKQCAKNSIKQNTGQGQTSRDSQCAEYRYFYKGHLTLVDGKLSGRISYLGWPRGEHVLLAAVAVTDEGAKQIENIRTAGHSDHTWKPVPDLQSNLDECALVSVVRGP